MGTDRGCLRLQLGIPVEVIEPAFVEIIGWEKSAVAVQFKDGRAIGLLFGPHPDFVGHLAPFREIAGSTSGSHVFPARLPAFRSRNDVIEGQILFRSAILAGETVAKKNVEPGKGGIESRFYVGLERYHARDAHFERRAAHHLVILGYDVHSVQKHRLDRILPTPKR